MERAQVKELRRVMKNHQIDAYIVVTDDFHASEYVGDYFKCREYISGFTGSAGTLVVTKTRAALWTDGRYFLQAADQLYGTGIELMRMGEAGVPSIEEFLMEQLTQGQSVGYDGRTITASYAEFLEEKLTKLNLKWNKNIDLVDEVWKDRPKMSAEPVWILEDKYSGESRKHKIEKMKAALLEANADTLLISALDEICWLYNIRGNDVEYNPVVLSYTLISKNYAYLYLNNACINEKLRNTLEKDGVIIKPYLQIYDDLKIIKSSRILCDKNAVNTAMLASIPQDVQIIDTVSPAKKAKAVKNPVEMKNEEQAHIQDGVAVTKLIYWLKTNFKKSRTNADVKITELDVCDKLEAFRKEADDYLGQSFAPIAGAGPHGAIIHYEPTCESNIELVDNSFCLLDTGGHYLSGTTDVTRTISLGELDEEQKRNYTAVLCGNLNIGSVYFKYGCSGANFDYLARTELWKLGLDYKHGTGHGVGYILNVHEGPNAIRLKNSDNSVGTVFEEGMITSNEPGVYLENKYGIRIENLIMCVKDKKTEYGQFMKMKTLTLVPFDRNAIDVTMLDSRQLKLLNEYHKQVFEKIGPMLNKEEKAWLKEETKALRQ